MAITFFLAHSFILSLSPSVAVVMAVVNSSYKKIDKIIALSNEDLNVVKAFSPKSDYSLIPTGVDLEHFKFKEKTGTNRSGLSVSLLCNKSNNDSKQSSTFNKGCSDDHGCLYF